MPNILLSADFDPLLGLSLDRASLDWASLEKTLTQTGSSLASPPDRDHGAAKSGIFPVCRMSRIQ